MNFLILDLGRSSGYLMRRECNLLFYRVALVPASDSLAKPIIDDILDVISTGSHYDGRCLFVMLLKGMILEQKKLAIVSFFLEWRDNNKMLH